MIKTREFVFILITCCFVFSDSTEAGWWRRCFRSCSVVRTCNSRSADNYIVVDVDAGAWDIPWRDEVIIHDSQLVSGMRPRLERRLASGRDDTALNGIELLTRYFRFGGGERVVAEEGYWGRWRDDAEFSTEYYIIGMRVRTEPEIVGDNTGLNGIELIGKHFGTGQIKRLPVTDGYWGEWTEDKFLPDGYYLAGIQVRMMPPQGQWDDVSMTGIRMIGKQLPNPVTSRN